MQNAMRSISFLILAGSPLHPRFPKSPCGVLRCGMASETRLEPTPLCDHQGEKLPNKIRLRLRVGRPLVDGGRKVIIRTFQFCRCGQQRGGRWTLGLLQPGKMHAPPCLVGVSCLDALPLRPRLTRVHASARNVSQGRSGESSVVQLPANPLLQRSSASGASWTRRHVA